jgi:5-methylcytosine-specific restriction endonuclease McrA
MPIPGAAVSMSSSVERRRQRREARGISFSPKSTHEPPQDADIRREKDRARHLRQSAWWTRKIREGICYYCHRQVGCNHLTMDHVIPLSRGGKSRKGNLVPACKECNNKKTYLLPVEWQEYLRRLSEENQTA